MPPREPLYLITFFPNFPKEKFIQPLYFSLFIEINFTTNIRLLPYTLIDKNNNQILILYLYFYHKYLYTIYAL